MAWRIKLSERARKDLAGLDRTIQRRIDTYLQERLSSSVNPRALGAALVGSEYGSFWKYRIGDYRIICDIQDATITILVIKIGNRREVYR